MVDATRSLVAGVSVLLVLVVIVVLLVLLLSLPVPIFVVLFLGPGGRRNDVEGGAKQCNRYKNPQSRQHYDSSCITSGSHVGIARVGNIEFSNPPCENRHSRCNECAD
jgi:hypothetical protein